MKLQDKEMIPQYTWFTVEQFDKLLSIVGPLFTKKCKKTLCNPEERLLVTLRFMETDSSFQTLAFQFCVGKTTETCEAVWNGLHKRDFLKPTEENWQPIAKFEQRWNFPHSKGTLDGKQTEYRNYKQHFGILLLTMCADDNKFTFVDISSVGCESNGGMFTKSLLGNMLKSGQLDLPKAKQIGNYADCIFPHLIVADVVLPLKETIVHFYYPLDHSEITKNFIIAYQRILDDRRTDEGRCLYRFFGIGKEIYGEEEDEYDPLDFLDEEDDVLVELPRVEWCTKINVNQIRQPLDQLRR